MTQTTLFICSLCRFSKDEARRDGISGGQTLIHHLQQALTARNLQNAVQLEPVRCMAGCSQPCNISLAAPGKLTFILSQISPIDGVEAVSKFCEQYTACPGGRVPYQERPQAIRESTAFVLPPLPQ